MQGEAIYKGATRPAMKLGIPLVPLVVLFGTGMLLIMWGGTLVSWWIALGVVVAFVPACCGCASSPPRTTSASARCSSP
jgi:type IV secretion system protein VirB3